MQVYHNLKSITKKKYGQDAVNVGDEGGFAPNVGSAEEALDLIMAAIEVGQQHAAAHSSRRRRGSQGASQAAWSWSACKGQRTVRTPAQAVMDDAFQTSVVVPAVGASCICVTLLLTRLPCRKPATLAR